MARKSKLTAGHHKKIVSALRDGATIRAACKLAGVSTSVYYRWIREGKEGVSPEKIQFWEDVTRARAQVKAEQASEASSAGRKSKLSEGLQNDLVALIEKGATDIDACEVVGISTSSFYRWMNDGQDGENENKLRFYLAITAARARARMDAVNTLMESLETREVRKFSTKTLTETRIDREGNPYEYTRTEEQVDIMEQPPDWRAAVDYLKRRDKEHWSERIEGDLTVKLSDDVAFIVKQLGWDVKEVVGKFETLIRQAAMAELFENAAKEKLDAS
jgi:predicted DNA-binding transcriptional regulator AlpA